MSLNKIAKNVNKTNSIWKDIKAVINLFTGDGNYAKRRAKNKAKAKIINKTFKF